MSGKKHIKVFVGSPDMDAALRKLLADKIWQWDKLNLKSEYMFIPHTWSDDCYPQTLPTPCDGQFCINSQLIDECDLLFAVIINGTGTPYVKDGKEFPCATLYEAYYHSRINKKNSYIFLNADDARTPHLDWINENGMGLMGKGNQDEFEKNVFEKITMILNRWVEAQTKHNNASKLLTFDARSLSDAASELIVYAMLANKKVIYVDDGKIFLDLTERKKHPFYFDFPLKGDKTVDDVLQELTGGGLLTALNQEEYELTKLVEEHREKLIQRDDKRILKQANDTLTLLLKNIRDENSIVVCEHNVEAGRWFLSIKQPGETEGFYSMNREWQEINHIVPILQKNGLVDAWYAQTKNKSRGMKITFEFVGDGCVFDLPPFPGAYTGVEGTITRRCFVLALRATYSNYDELRGNDN